MKSPNARKFRPADSASLTETGKMQIQEDILERVFRDGIPKPVAAEEAPPKQEEAA